MIQYFPMDLKPVSVLQLWGQYNIPVYETSVIQSSGDVSSFIANNDYYVFGDHYNDAPLDSAQGIYREKLPLVLDTYLDFGNGSVVLDSGTFTYGSYSGDFIFEKFLQTSNKGNNIITTYKYTQNNYPLIFISANNSERTDIPGDNVAFGSSSYAILFLSFEEDGVRKYVRLPLIFNMVTNKLTNGYLNEYPAVLGIDKGSSNNSAYLSFFSVRYGVVTTLDKIAGGTAVELDPIIGPTNPYQPADPSGPGDLPPGTFDDNSDPIPLPSLPTLSAANTGFTRIYNPTLSQVQALARYLWTDETVIETIWNHIKQYFEDPMQAIIGFNLVPVPVPDGGTQNFALMYIDTGVSMTVAANQFVDVDCGTVDLTRYYGSALDQSPYTKVHCFLPYIGMVELNTDEVMGTTLSVNYRVDIVSGSCVASVLVDGNVLYQYSGHCAITIPFSSADFSSYVNAAIQVAKMVGLGVASGVGAAVESAAVESGEQQTGKTITKRTESRKTIRNPETGRQITTATSSRVQTIDLPDSDGGTKASYYGLTPTNIANTVGQVIASKRVVQHSGSFSGNSGYLGVRRPYLIIERPRMCLPSNYQSLNGYPAMITMSLGECKGFTRVQQVQLTGLYATNPEQAEIMELLKMGVVF